MLHTKIEVELQYRIKNDPLHCHNCQFYGYTDNYCHRSVHCVKCGGEHSTDICSKDKSSPTQCIL